MATQRNELNFKGQNIYIGIDIHNIHNIVVNAADVPTS
jgi:hypothetical protein